MPKADAIGVLLAGRSGVYRLCQSILGNEPSVELLEQLTSEPVSRVLQLFSDEQTEFKQAAQALVAQADEYMIESEASLDTLKSSFTQLFIGPGMTKAPPWESYYLGTHRALFEKVTLDVRKAYVEQGLLPAAYPHVADDHIGIELDFLARLAERAETLYENGDIVAAKGVLSASEAFVREHLAKWAPDFMAMVAKARQPGLYLKAAALLVAFLPVDLSALGELQTALGE
jgi:TorA maturation chaperone TorD